MEWQPPLEALFTAFVRPFCSFNAFKKAILRPSCFQDHPAKAGEECRTTVERGHDWGMEHLALILEDKVSK
jgi:hypothetical protein